MDRYSYKKNNSLKQSNLCDEYYLNKTNFNDSDYLKCNKLNKIKGEMGEKGEKGEMGLEGKKGISGGNTINCQYSNNENLPNSIKLIGNTNYYEDQINIIINTNNNENNIFEFLKSISIGDKIKVTNINNINNFGLYLIESYFEQANKFGLKNIISSGQFFENNIISFEIIYSGIKGEKGDMGNVNLQGINIEKLLEMNFSRSNIINSDKTFGSYSGDWYQFYENKIYNVNNLGYGFFLPPGFSNNLNFKFSDYLANISLIEYQYISNNTMIDINNTINCIGNVFSYKTGCLEGASISVISQSEFIKKTVGFRISVEKHSQTFFEPNNIGTWTCDNTQFKDTLPIIDENRIISKGTRIRDNDNNGKIAIHQNMITDLNTYVNLYEGSGYDKDENFHITNNKLILNQNDLICIVFTPITSDSDINELSQQYIHNNWNNIMKLLNISVTLKISILEK